MKLTAELAQELLDRIPAARAIVQDADGVVAWTSRADARTRGTGFWQPIAPLADWGVLGVYGLADVVPRIFRAEVPVSEFYPEGTLVRVSHGGGVWYTRYSAGRVNEVNYLECWHGGSDRFTSEGKTCAWEIVEDCDPDSVDALK